MSSALTPRLFISSGCSIARKRELPIPGELKVSVGDSVIPSSIIGTTKLEGEVVLLRIKEQLGLSPARFVSGLLIKEGDKVEEQSEIFNQRGPFGFFSSSFRSPYAGVVEFISETSGTVGIRLAPREFSLLAYVSGMVTQIEPQKSATIEGSGSLIQGIFGVGNEQLGKIVSLSVGIDQPIQISDLPFNCSGYILVGGTSPSGAVLKEAASRGAVGFVTGGIEDSALKDFLGFDVGIAMTGGEKISMSVIITEGFGKLSMNARISKIASMYDGCDAALNGTTQIRAGAIRPELLIFPPKEKIMMESSQEEIGFHEGARIRGTREPYFGKSGVIKSLPVEVELLETGIASRVALVKFDSGEEARVPRANLEML